MQGSDGFSRVVGASSRGAFDCFLDNIFDGVACHFLTRLLYTFLATNATKEHKN